MPQVFFLKKVMKHNNYFFEDLILYVCKRCKALSTCENCVMAMLVCCLSFLIYFGGKNVSYGQKNYESLDL
jgi:tRNA(Arg) A34 adenosine deaminase TadA